MLFGYDSVIKDKLVNIGGNAVTYANVASLNPTSWNGRNYDFEGRRLTSFSYNGKTCSYDYDDQSHRIWKSVNGVGTSYTYNGDKLIIEDGINGKLFFLYDENNELYGFVKDEKKYFYINDITGTIYGIVNESGTLVGKYEYSAYGKCTVLVDIDKIATINPFRFKCYYYDSESEMYYCHTRYFVPEWGRWLNADTTNYLKFDNINGMNLFAYCCNDPISNEDPEGNWSWKKFFKALLTVVTVVAVVAVAVVATPAVAAAVVAGAALGATVSDVVNIATGEVHYEANQENGTIKIVNSNKVVTPWVQFGYSFYLNHINSNTKDIFQGSSFGMQVEWGLHNLAYYACTVANPFATLLGKPLDGVINSAQHVDMGKTLFSDVGHGVMGAFMKIYYLVTNPIPAVFDLIKNGGFNP